VSSEVVRGDLGFNLQNIYAKVVLLNKLLSDLLNDTNFNSSYNNLTANNQFISAEKNSPEIYRFLLCSYPH
jgi:hypothetical protein